MATQGTISFLRGNKVVMKIIAGCDGNKAADVADIIKKSWPFKTKVMSPQKAYKLALAAGLGSASCLVVMTKSNIVFNGEENISPLYRRMFNFPRFNPRWKNGSADHTIVIQL